MTRTKLLAVAALLATGAQAAQAQSCGGRTVEQIIANCDAAFPGISPLMMSARGWCYLINGASCALP